MSLAEGLKDLDEGWRVEETAHRGHRTFKPALGLWAVSVRVAGRLEAGAQAPSFMDPPLMDYL